MEIVLASKLNLIILWLMWTHNRYESGSLLESLRKSETIKMPKLVQNVLCGGKWEIKCVPNRYKL